MSIEDTPKDTLEMQSVEPVAHLVCPMVLPDLDRLTMTQLQSLRGYIQAQGREARKKASQAINKVPHLRDLWLATLRQGASPEERQQAVEHFHGELGMYPDPFLKHMYANAIIAISDMIRDNSLKRANSSPEPPKRRRA